MYPLANPQASFLFSKWYICCQICPVVLFFLPFFSFAGPPAHESLYNRLYFFIFIFLSAAALPILAHADWTCCLRCWQNPDQLQFTSKQWMESRADSPPLFSSHLPSLNPWFLPLILSFRLCFSTNSPHHFIVLFGWWVSLKTSKIQGAPPTPNSKLNWGFLAVHSDPGGRASLVMNSTHSTWALKPAFVLLWGPLSCHFQTPTHITASLVNMSLDRCWCCRHRLPIRFSLTESSTAGNQSALCSSTKCGVFVEVSQMRSDLAC